MVNKNSLTYIEGLDGIRGMATLLVVSFHNPVGIFRAEFGWIGVNQFFMLSGFLITRILLFHKGESFFVYYRNFLIRRVLRIIPLYLLYLFVTYIVLLWLNGIYTGTNHAFLEGIADVRRNLGYLLTYTYNIGTVINFFQGREYHNSIFTGHLWSLSVEEQFYLVLPIAVYFLSTRFLQSLCLSLVVLMPVLRLVFVLIAKEKVHDLFWIGEVLYTFTLFQLDSICLGILLASKDFSHLANKVKELLLVIAVVSLTIGILHLVSINTPVWQIPIGTFGIDNPVYHLITKASPLVEHRYVYMYPLINLSFFLLLLGVITGSYTPILLQSSFLVKTGKVSYGIYVFHLGLSYLIPLLVKKTLPDTINESGLLYNLFIQFTYLLGVFLLASMSYHKFECRFLAIKKKFIQPME